MVVAWFDVVAFGADAVASFGVVFGLAFVVCSGLDLAADGCPLGGWW